MRYWSALSTPFVNLLYRTTAYGFFISIFVFLSFRPVFTILASWIVFIIRTILLSFHTCTNPSPFLRNTDCPFFKHLPSSSRSRGMPLLRLIVPQTLTFLSSMFQLISHCYNNPYPTAFLYGNGMVLHFYQQQESSMTKTVHKVINKGLKAYV